MPARDAPASPTAPQRDQQRGRVALLLIDVINCFDFAGAEKLRTAANRIVDPILSLREQVIAAHAPVIYVNDNFGEWHSNRSRLVERGLERNHEFVAQLAPREDDYFIIKPQLSGFYATNLPVLLPKLGASRIILTGIATDICVLFTAADAHMRDYAIWVPEDAVAAEDAERDRSALAIMRDHLGAETAGSDRMDVAAWMASLDDAGRA